MDLLFYFAIVVFVAIVVVFFALIISLNITVHEADYNSEIDLTEYPDEEIER